MQFHSLSELVLLQTTFFLGITYTVMAPVTKHYLSAVSSTCTLNWKQRTSKASGKSACVQSI